MSKVIKTYEELVPGDKMYSETGEHFIGTLIRKGKASDLSEDEIADWDMSPEEIDDYDLVLINEQMGNFDDDKEWYNYAGDPSGAVCYKDIIPSFLGNVAYWNSYSNPEEKPETDSVEDFVKLMEERVDIWEELAEDGEVPEQSQWNMVYFASVHKYKGGKIDAGVIDAMLAQL
jgi:hypothetical protein